MEDDPTAAAITDEDLGEIHPRYWRLARFLIERIRRCVDRHHHELVRSIGRLDKKLETLVALNDAQQTELLDAISTLGTDITAAADRVIAALEAANIADPEVTQAIADLKALGDQANTIAANPENPPAPV